MKSEARMISSLFRFMLIFEINRFWIISASKKTIKARVGWAAAVSSDCMEDDEIQDIEWEVQSFDNFEDALKVSEFLIDNGLMLNDKITVDSEKLLELMGWKKDRYDAAIKTLLNIKVDMLDEGKKTDYFFVHF